MKTHLDCIPCFISQALRAGKEISNDEIFLKSILDRICGMVKDFSLDKSTPEIADLIYSEIKIITKNMDPFSKKKKQNIEEALRFEPELKQIVENSDDKLLTAIRIAIAGNVIDLGANVNFDLRRDVNQILKQDFAIFHYEEFKEYLNQTEKILYIGDNAGESVFDKILIEQLGRPVIYAVRDEAVINDVTFDDAIASGLEKFSKIISSGCSAPSTLLERCSDEFLNEYHTSKLIISKGQGNYEGLSDTKDKVFFLLKAKCPVIADYLNVNINDIVLKLNS